MTTDICINHHGGNPQSEAANKATNKHRDRARILAHLLTVPDATCDEVEIALGMAHQTCSARFTELGAEGRIEPAGRRKTRTGCTAMVWRRV